MKQRSATYYTSFIFCILFFVACKKEGAGTAGEKPEPYKTEKGTPTGQGTTKFIGNSGGELISDDGKVKIVVPQGAVNSNTAFSIQPIVNTLYDEDPSKQAYRLLPEGTSFLKPLQVIFTYEMSQYKNSVQDLLTVAWQQPDGAWKIVPSSLNKAAKTLTIETDHFSDWTVTGGFELRYHPVLKTKGKTEIRVFAASDDDLLAPLVLSDADIAGITTLGNWNLLRGGGTLQPHKGSRGFEPTATYTAPATVNGSMNVEISMEIAGFNKIKDPSAPGGIRASGQMLLVAYITVTDNYMIGSFGGERIELTGNMVSAVSMLGAIIISGQDNKYRVGLNALANAAGTYPCGQQFIPGKTWVYVDGLTGSFASHSSMYIECGPLGEQKFSPSSLTISKWAAVGEFIEGHYTGPVYETSVCSGAPKELSVIFSVLRMQ